MERPEVRRIVSEELDEVFPEKYCPHCKADTTMIKVEVWDENDSYVRYRCLNCLKLFTEELREVRGMVSMDNSTNTEALLDSSTYEGNDE